VDGEAFYDPEFLKDTTDRGKLCGSARASGTACIGDDFWRGGVAIVRALLDLRSIPRKKRF